MGSPVRQTIAVLGGGIAGLSAAFAARGASRTPLEIVVIDSCDRLGGWLDTDTSAGFIFERGCRGLRPQGSGRAALQLIELLGLAEHTLTSSSTASSRYLWHNGRLEKLPGSLREAVRSPLTRHAPAWLMRDLSTPGRLSPASTTSPPLPSNCPGFDDGLESEDDESVFEFAARRLDPFVGGVLLDAAFSGVYAGDTRALSARAVISRLWRSEAVHGGLVRGAALDAWDRWREGVSSEDRAAGLDSPFVRACRAASSVSFTGGIAMLPAALESALQRGHGQGAVTFHRGTAVQSIGRDGAGRLCIRVVAGGKERTIVADSAVCTLPAHALAAVLRGQGGHGTEEEEARTRAVGACEGMPYASVGVVCMGWDHGGGGRGGGAKPFPVIPHSGFGYLVPSGERGPGVQPGSGHELLARARAWASSPSPSPSPPPVPVLGMIWDSQVFPGQSKAWREGVRAGARGREGGGGLLLPVRGDDVWESVRRSETRATVMLGGMAWPEAAALPHDDLAAIGKAALSVHVGGGRAGASTPEPDVLTVTVASRAIPQYNVGHVSRVRALDAAIGDLFSSKLVMAGNAHRGVGVADAVANGLEAGRLAVQRAHGAHAT